MARRIEDLADGIRSRDPESIRALFRAHHGMVFRFIRSVCRSRDEAEELTARAFFRLVDLVVAAFLAISSLLVTGVDRRE